MKIDLNQKLAVEAEYCLRKTTTDYLDDVSTRYPDPSVFGSDKDGRTASFLSLGKNLNAPQQEQGIRGDSQHKDWYNTLSVAITYAINSWQ